VDNKADIQLWWREEIGALTSNKQTLGCHAPYPSFKMAEILIKVGN
jgi:hypothetical protein